MIENDKKGYITIKNDKKVATFNSAFKSGNIELWYCAHRNVYELRYDVQFYTSDGLTDAVALSSYDAGDYVQVGGILADAIELAGTPLLERD